MQNQSKENKIKLKREWTVDGKDNFYLNNKKIT